MSERIYVRDMVLTRDRVRWITRDGRDVSVPYDGNLGHLMAGVSSMAKTLAGLPAETEALTSDVELDVFRIEPVTVAPYAFRLVLASGPYQVTCHLDRDLEHILAGFGAAMRFFALKRGLVVVEEEVTRNRDRAGEAGFLTGSA